METQGKLTVGMIGCGYQGGRLASAIQLTGSLAVTACMDIDLQAAQRLAGNLDGANIYHTTEELLEKSGVDVVMVASPHDVLAEISLKAIQAGKHVLAEKPLGLSDRDLDLVAETLETTPVCYLPGYSFRFLPAWTKVKELIGQGVVGEILSIEGCYAIGSLDEDWIALPERGGGPLLFVGSHLIDQACWYLQDEPVSVFGKVRYRRDTNADETSVFQIDYAGGASTQFIVSQGVQPGTYRLGIYGRHGHIHLSATGFLDYEIEVASSAVEAYAEPAVLHPQTDLDPRDHMHLQQLTGFVKAIREGGQLAVSLHEGRRVLKIIDAVHESSRTGKAMLIG